MMNGSIPDKVSRRLGMAVLAIVLTAPAGAAGLSVAHPADALDHQVEISVESMPVERFLTHLMSLASLETTVTGPLDGTVTGRFDGSVHEVLDSVAAANDLAFWATDERLVLAPSGSLTDESVSWSVQQAPALASELTTLLHGNAHNTIEATDTGLSLRGLPAFLDKARAEVEARRVPEVIAPGQPAPDSPPAALIGLDTIPGFNTL